MSSITDTHDPPFSIPAPSTLAVDIAAASDAPQFKHWLCSVEKYHEMGRLGILAPEDRVELLEGYIVYKNPPGDGPLFRLWRCSVEKYHEMGRAGILTDDDRVELLEGWIVDKMTKYPLHRLAAYRLLKVLEKSIPGGFYADGQNPVALAGSEPEPDAVVVRGDSDDFGDRHPGPADVVLLAEVADSSLPYDRDDKKRIYAKNGIAVYWVVNLVDRRIEVYTQPGDGPSGADYARCEIYTLPDNVPLIVDGRKLADIPVRSIIPEQTVRPD